MCVPEALEVAGFGREETLHFNDPGAVMQRFSEWVDARGNAEAFLTLIEKNDVKVAL
jgi:hypothetical protein